jgi:hypothetical protein
VNYRVGFHFKILVVLSQVWRRGDLSCAPEEINSRLERYTIRVWGATVILMHCIILEGSRVV